MKKIPCKTCIALAACVAKEEIDCSLVYDILRKEIRINEGSKVGKICVQTRAELQVAFPNMKTITHRIAGNPRLIFKGFNDDTL